MCHKKRYKVRHESRLESCHGCHFDFYISVYFSPTLFWAKPFVNSCVLVVVALLESPAGKSGLVIIFWYVETNGSSSPLVSDSVHKGRKRMGDSPLLKRVEQCGGLPLRWSQPTQSAAFCPSSVVLSHRWTKPTREIRAWWEGGVEYSCHSVPHYRRVWRERRLEGHWWTKTESGLCLLVTLRLAKSVLDMTFYKC